MSSKVLDELKESNIVIYELLKVPRDANDRTIKKAYRKQALVYHPDKNPTTEASHKFHLLGLALTVLSDAQLRVDYDNWIKSQELLIKRQNEESNDRKRKREELIRAESAAKSQGSKPWTKSKDFHYTSRYSTEVERLREEGIKKRRELEAEHLSKLTYKSTAQPNDNKLNKTIKVRWKVKEGIVHLFTDDVIEGIFSIFGDVEQIEKAPHSPSDKRYDTRKVIFKSANGAARAAAHDFSVKSTIWDKTSYRKLSGLIREAKWLKESNRFQVSDVLNKDELTLEEYKNLTLLRLQKLDNNIDSSRLI